MKGSIGMSKELILQLDDKLSAKRESFDKIPVVDIAALLDGSDKTSVAKEMRWALSNAGFMYIKNHGVATQQVDAAFHAARRFFDLPLEEKEKLHISKSDVSMRGYIEIFGENTDPTKTRDLKECYDLGPERSGPVTPFFGPNLWPTEAYPEFQNVIYAYHDTMVSLAKSLLKGIALSLDLDEDYFVPKMQDPISILRLLHYPPQEGKVDESVIGTGAHTDYGNLTILAQDDVGGLQVMNREGQWVEAPYVSGTFVINIGDLIQRLTNDVYLANLHRVINTSGRERYSIPFFIDADFTAQFDPLENCITEENPRKYESIVCGEHKFDRFVKSFPHLQGKC